MNNIDIDFILENLRNEFNRWRLNINIRHLDNNRVYYESDPLTNFNCNNISNIFNVLLCTQSLSSFPSGLDSFYIQNTYELYLNMARAKLRTNSLLTLYFEIVKDAIVNNIIPTEEDYNKFNKSDMNGLLLFLINKKKVQEYLNTHGHVDYLKLNLNTKCIESYEEFINIYTAI